MNIQRRKILKEGIERPGPVIYWMQRDQRVHDNWALLYAQQISIEKNLPFFVVFNLDPELISSRIRHSVFLLKGLEEVEVELSRYNIPLKLLVGDPSVEIPKYITIINASIIVSDFNPLKNILKWKNDIADKIEIPFHEVDAHNIVPCRIASDKMEYAAYTFRPKVHKLLPLFLDEFPKVKKMQPALNRGEKINWEKVRKELKINLIVTETASIKPGESAAHEMLDLFINTKLQDYDLKHSDPTLNNISDLSPYLNYGQISAQRIAIILQFQNEHTASKHSFLEELIVRRELADNFCFFNKNYDSFEGFPNWGKETLNAHRYDKREFIYSLDELEKANTHDALWNAAQNEMTVKAKMHGYMRMYWAKKILEWTQSPEIALQTAIYLNDKYELDGIDPNGFTGIAWSIGGVHDRAWKERKVFGKIRYMNYSGCKRKFDIKKYIKNNPGS
jgi:deoxyribodipyrimidine photo-lyase